VVPYTVGTSVAGAETALQQAGYPSTTQQLASTRPAGEVIGQSPQGNVTSGTKVTLQVSSGPAG
jgi:beta-lactam-binding protein with PASTA domain